MIIPMLVFAGALLIAFAAARSMRRATMSLAIHWSQRCSNKRQATLRGFYDDMKAKGCRKALSLVTRSKPTWLPKT